MRTSNLVSHIIHFYMRPCTEYSHLVFFLLGWGAIHYVALLLNSYLRMLPKSRASPYISSYQYIIKYCIMLISKSMSASIPIFSHSFYLTCSRDQICSKSERFHCIFVLMTSSGKFRMPNLLANQQTK